MLTWKQVSYSIGLRFIQQAYTAGRTAFDAEKDDWNAKWEEHEKAVTAGTAVTEKVDEETGYYFDFGEYVGEMLDDAEEGLRHIREAFLLSVYHYWEKRACELLGLKSYDARTAYKRARLDASLGFQEAGIERLRLIANCIKHDNGRDLYTVAPELFDPGLLPIDLTATRGWQASLRLTDTELEKAFKVVAASGPLKPKPAGNIEEVTF